MGYDVSLAVAFIAGFFSFINPCVLPLVPGFLGYLSGISLAEARYARFKVFLNSLFFVLGFSTVFAAMGVLFNSLLQNVSSVVKEGLSRIGGVIIFVFGLHVLGLLKIRALETEHKIALKGALAPSYFLSFIFGAVFAVGWTPCVGAILGSVLALAVSNPSLSFLLLLSYALGLGLPFLVVGLFSSWALALIQKSGNALKYFNFVVGIFLLVLGVLVFTRNLSLLVNEDLLNKAFTGKELATQNSGKGKKYPKAKELVSPDGYINTERIDLASLIGKKVILLDFWTYSCINCQRSLPYLKNWYEKYKDQGLEIIGVHSPEFEFERSYDNVLAAVKKWRIPYPVVLDNNHYNLRLYETIYWPTEVLIDIDGFIVHKSIGEGGYEETETKIQELLEERRAVLGTQGSSGKKEIAVPQGAVSVDFFKIGTPEIYLGSRTTRGNFGNPEGLFFDKTGEYALPGKMEPNKVYIQGLWHNGSDYLELKGEKGRIVLIYKAKVVNIVAGAMSAQARMKIKVDGAPVGEAVVAAFDLYNIVSGEEYGTHKLEIEIEGPGFAAYAFTFG